MHELDLVAAVVEQRREPAADPEVELHPRVLRVLVVHVVALLVGDHLERQLVVVAQEQAPLRVVRDRRRAARGSRCIGVASSRRSAMNMRGITGKWNAMWHSSPSPKYVDDVGRPLVRLGEQHAVRVVARRPPRAPASGTRASPAGSRSSSRRARRGTARRRGGSRRARGRARSAARRASPPAPRGCRS